MEKHLSKPTRRLLGRRIGSIRVLELLGRGGMGEVYVGFDETLERRVALKAIGTRHRFSTRSKARFLREARVLSRLEHPSICRIHDYIEDDEGAFLVLELIEGKTLTLWLAEATDAARRTTAAIRIGEVLEAAHGQGVVHRDLKPDNVMVTPEGEIKVLDFGLARSEETETAEPTGDGSAEERPDETRAAADPVGLALDVPAASSAGTELFQEDEDADHLETRRGQIVGTPIYMSPEQARGEAVTTASDIYSFGLVLQTLFSGHSPYPEGLDRTAILKRAREANTLPVGDMDRDLTALIGRMKSMAPAARPTAATALERLRWIRDKPKRRLRRLIAAAVLAAVALAGAKYTLDLRAARDEANRRREQAESLIGYMIGDLRSKLAPVNRLEVLDDIGDRALAYFGAVPAAELSDEDLLFRSQTLSQIGQVRMDQGDLPAAKEAFEESLELGLDLATRDRERADWQVWLGAAHFWVGEAARRQNDLDGALASFAEYLQVSERLVERDPENLDWQLELGYAHTNVGSVLEARGEAAEAIEAFRRSLVIKQKLVAARPDNTRWRSDLAAGHSWLGEALFANGDLAGALESYEANRTILDELVAEDPANNRWHWLLGIAHEKVGIALVATGSPEEAAREFDTYLALNEELVRGDPGNSAWRRELGVAHMRLSEALSALGQLDQARDSLRSAERLLQDLVEQDPTNSDWQFELAWASTALARLLGPGEAGGTALDASLKAVELSEQLAERATRDTAVRLSLSDAYLVRGEVLARNGHRQEALEAFRKAHQVIEPIAVSSSHPTYRRVWATALLRLGLVEEARPIVARLHREGYRLSAFVQLCRDSGVWP